MYHYAETEFFQEEWRLMLLLDCIFSWYELNKEVTRNLSKVNSPL